MDRDWWQLTPRRVLYSIPECVAATDSRVSINNNMFFLLFVILALGYNITSSECAWSTNKCDILNHCSNIPFVQCLCVLIAPLTVFTFET